MDMLNHIPKPFYNNDSERENAALYYLDIILPYLPDYTEFMLHEKFREYPKFTEGSKQISEVQDLIEYTLLENQNFVLKKLDIKAFIKEKLAWGTKQ